MKIWYDACTGKHIRYGTAIAKRLRRSGHTLMLTTRRHPDTLTLAENLGENFLPIGQYDPISLLTRTRGSLNRQLSFCKLFSKESPDLAISHGSVDQCRVAFGLQIPIIITFDAPHAEAVNRLTIPLVDHIVFSKGIPKSVILGYSKKCVMTSFDGVDETAWIKELVARKDHDHKEPLIVVREFEERAVYAQEHLDLLHLAKKMTRLGQVMFLSRYQRKNIKGLIVPKTFIDTASLVAQADLFIGAGGTITREAALQGTPALVAETSVAQYVNDYLAAKGFPIFRVQHSELKKAAEKLLGQKTDVAHLLEKLENPVEIIAKNVLGVL